MAIILGGRASLYDLRGDTVWPTEGAPHGVRGGLLWLYTVVIVF